MDGTAQRSTSTTTHRRRHSRPYTPAHSKLISRNNDTVDLYHAVTHVPVPMLAGAAAAADAFLFSWGLDSEYRLGRIASDSAVPELTLPQLQVSDMLDALAQGSNSRPITAYCLKARAVLSRSKVGASVSSASTPEWATVLVWLCSCLHCLTAACLVPSGLHCVALQLRAST